MSYITLYFVSSEENGKVTPFAIIKNLCKTILLIYDKLAEKHFNKIGRFWEVPEKEWDKLLYDKKISANARTALFFAASNIFVLKRNEFSYFSDKLDAFINVN